MGYTYVYMYVCGMYVGEDLQLESQVTMTSLA